MNHQKTEKSFDFSTWSDSAAPQRVPRVRISGQKQALRVPQVAAGFGQFHEGKILVVAHQHSLDIRIQRTVRDVGTRLLVPDLLHDVHPSILQLPHHPAASDHIHLPLDPRHVPQVRGGAVRRAEDLLLRHVREAQAAELLHVALPGPGAVVGDEEHPLAPLFEQAHHLRSSGHGRLAVPDDAVAVEQHVVLRVQQVPELRAAERHAAPVATRRACHSAGSSSYDYEG